MLHGNQQLIQQRMAQAQQQQGVLTGNRQQVGGMQQPQMPGAQPQQQQLGGMQQQQQGSALAQMVAISNRFAGNVNGNQNGMAGLYNFSQSNSNLAALMGMDEGMAEEQMRMQAINQASQMANMVMMACLRRQNNNPFVRSFRGAMERFKHPRRNLPQEQILIDFVNEMDANQNLYNFIVVNACIQFTSEVGFRIMSGDQSVTQQREALEEIIFKTGVDSINLQFIDYICSHPDGASIYYRASPTVKEALQFMEEVSYQAAVSRFNWIGQQCPWKNGRLGEMQTRNTVSNPLLDFQNFGQVADYGFGAGYVDANPSIAPMSANDALERQKTLDYINRMAARTPEPIQQRQEEIAPAMYSHLDKPTLRVDDLTESNRREYILADLGVMIPGTEYWVFDDQTMRQVVRSMRDTNGEKVPVRELRDPSVIPVFKIDWEAGVFEYRLLKHKFKGAFMSQVISDPSVLLPLMYEENGLQKTTFDPTVLETSKLVVNGKIIPIEEVKELDKQPDVMIGSKPFTAEMSNTAILDKVETVVKTFDKESKMDAFILPMVAMRQWHIENHVNMDDIYSDFACMVKGGSSRAGVTDTARVIRTIRAAARNTQSEEFKSFLDPYLTALINRYLVECRGYAETPEEAKAESIRGLTIDSAFEDLDDLLEWFKDNDQATLVAFLNYNSNDFMRNGIEILMPRVEAEAHNTKVCEVEEDELIRATMIADRNQSVMMKRDTTFININEQGPRQTDAVIIKESINPKLFAIVRKALKRSEEHFDEVPQVLIKFLKDEHNKVWVATPSEIDPEHVLVLRCVSETESYTHPWMVHAK